VRLRRYPWPAGVAGPAARSLVPALTLVLALPGSTGAQSAPAFSGRYRFVMTVSPSCPPAMQVGPLSVVMDVAEEAVMPGGAEVSGQPASPSETPQNGRFVLLREADRIHGGFSSSTIELGLDTEGIYRLWLEVIADGTVTVSSGGRARASGTAFGEVELSLASDPTGAPIDNGNGNCGFATRGHQWSLEPA
jgi:hypothetical protein